MIRSRHWIHLAALPALAIGTLPGCASMSAELIIRQEHAPPSQKHMTLKSDWAFTARQDDRRLCLADFSLPGAVEGPRDFRVFVLLPAIVESAEIGEGPTAASGFFLQKVGRLRGKAEFSSGKVRLETTRFNSRLRDLILDVACADGTQISGQARLRESDEELRLFLLQHAGDVAALDAATAGPTAKRGEADVTQAAEQSDTE